MSTTSNPSDRDRQIDEIVAGYLEAEAKGQGPDRAKLLARHHAFAEELNGFFADHDAVKQMARPAPATLPPESSETDAAAAPTLSPTEHSPPVAQQSPGTKIRYFGDYEIIEEIARGGMGVVYKARQISLNRIVALKMILAGQLASPADVQRFQKEAEAAANLKHPNIVAIHEVGQHDGQHYFSMDYIPGQNLADAVRQGTLAPKQAARYVRIIAEAIHFAHQHGTLHRDLKPSNILIDSTDQPHVTDFGLAKRVEGEAQSAEREAPGTPRPARHALTQTGQVLGTPSYMPPEQAGGKPGQVGPASDIYALGAILYYLVTARPPFQAATPLDTLMQVLDTELEPQRPRFLNRNIDRDLETICLKCIQKDAQRRYQSPRHLADDLDRYLDGEPIQARPIGPFGRVTSWTRRRPALAATIAGVFVFYTNYVLLLSVGLASEKGRYLWFVSVLGGCWIATAAAFQGFTANPNWRSVATYSWAGADVVLFSVLLFISDEARSALVVGYFLLVAGAALRFRLALVWCVTGLCVLSYAVLWAHATWWNPDCSVDVRTGVIVMLGLIIMGFMTYLTLRQGRRTMSVDW